MYNKFSIDYGIILISGSTYRCYIVTVVDTSIEFKMVRSGTEHLQKKQKKGGSSAPRLQRKCLEQKSQYVKKITDAIVNTYMKNNHTECVVEGLIIGGPAEFKNKVIVTELFQQYFNNRIKRVVNTDEITDNTIHIVCKMCSGVLLPHVNNDFILTELNNYIAIGSERLAFGEDIDIYMEMCCLEKIIISNEQYDEFIKKYPNTKCQIFRIFGSEIDDYGKIVGIKYF